MIGESTMIPIPSEAIMTPAWAMAALWDINPYIIVVAWTVWSLIWSLISYFIGKKWWELLSEKMFGKKWHQIATEYFKNNGNLTIFVSRLLPVIRHWISIPAGAFNMPLVPFITWTTIGAFLWCSILTIIWYKIGENRELLEPYKMPLLIGWLFVFGIALFVKKMIQKHYK
jgi:membrane protein DedA with SNARE-associated domain